MTFDEQTTARLLEMPTGNVADNDPNGGVMDAGIRPLDPGMHMVGRALTVKCHPGDNLALYQGIEAAQQGDVLVFDCGGYEAGHFGDMMAHACQAKGIAGVVIDGTNRDRNDICALGLPVFSRGTCPAGTTKAVLGQIGVPVVVGGVAVRTGDVIFADCDGVVVVPQEDADEVFERALAKHEHEEVIARRIMAGEPIMGIYGFDRVVERLAS